MIQSHEIFQLSVLWVCLMEILLLVCAAVMLQCDSEIVSRLINEEVNSILDQNDRGECQAVEVNA